MKFYTKSSGVLDISKQSNLVKLKIQDLIDGCKNVKRFGSQIDWSVYQHSILVGNLAALNGEESSRGILACFLHDLSEGLLGDMQAPLRDNIKTRASYYEDCHNIINKEISARFNLGNKENSLWTEICDNLDVKFYDTLAFWIEYYYFIAGKTENSNITDFNIPSGYIDKINIILKEMKIFPHNICSFDKKIEFLIENVIKVRRLEDEIQFFNRNDILTVGKLIEKLKKFDSNVPILIVDGYECKVYSKNLAKMLVDKIELDGKTYVELAIGGLEDREEEDSFE